jgi:hypothetical protein
VSWASWGDRVWRVTSDGNEACSFRLQLSWANAPGQLFFLVMVVNMHSDDPNYLQQKDFYPQKEVFYSRQWIPIHCWFGTQASPNQTNRCSHPSSTCRTIPRWSSQPCRLPVSCFPPQSLEAYLLFLAIS